MARPNLTQLRNGRCGVLAEAGQCMEGSITRAVQMVEDAAEAGAWGIKVQLLTPNKIATPEAPKYWDDDLGTLTQQQAFTRAGLIGYDEWQPVRDAAARSRIAFIATPFDLDAVDALERLDVDGYKIASGDLLNIPLINAVVRTKRLILLATGAAWEDEVESTVDEMLHVDPSVRHRLILLGCSLVYPTPQDDANIGRITRLRELVASSGWTGIRVGYSDHTTEPNTAQYAAAAGACVVEKHYTYADPTGPVPDHGMAVDPAGLKETVRYAKRGAEAFGNPSLMPTEAEERARVGARRGIWLTKDVKAGDAVCLTDGEILRPCPETAMPPDIWYRDCEGATYTADIKKGNCVLRGDVLLGHRRPWPYT